MFVSLTHRLPLPRLPQEIFLVHVSFRGWVKARTTVRPEWLRQGKISKFPSEIEPTTFRYGQQCLNQLHYRLPRKCNVCKQEMLHVSAYSKITVPKQVRRPSYTHDLLESVKLQLAPSKSCRQPLREICPYWWYQFCRLCVEKWDARVSAFADERRCEEDSLCADE